jgi:ubiquinone/menaquinone biosynthesis C-methylase UbiE
MNHRDLVAATYSAAADHYDALSFWQYYGERTVARAGLPAGGIVLDVCSGTGASAIPAAKTVGPAGRVIGLDLAPGMVDLARTKAAGLANIEFRGADFDQAYFRPGTFDAVLCVFGIFFFPDMRATLQKMWRLLRPGGRLAVTTWSADLFEPANTVFWDAVREVRPELYKGFNAWDKLTTPALVEDLFEQAGVAGVEIEAEERDHPLRSAEDWWAIVMGTGYRGTLDRLTAEERDQVRAACMRVTCESLRAGVLYARAVRRA